MHPHLSGELARLRAQDIAREAAAHHAHHVHRREIRPAGLLFNAPIRGRIGVALIRIGMRIVDPDHQLRRVPSPR